MNLPEGWPTEYEKFSTWWENQKSYMAASKFEYWECWQASALAAPTPPAQENLSQEAKDWYARIRSGKQPAQEDGPVLFVNSISLEREGCPATQSFQDEYFDTPLYTRPDDRLRKAAESLAALSDRWGTQMPYGIKVGIEELRAALEGK